MWLLVSIIVVLFPPRIELEGGDGCFEAGTCSTMCFGSDVYFGHSIFEGEDLLLSGQCPGRVFWEGLIILLGGLAVVFRVWYRRIFANSSG